MAALLLMLLPTMVWAKVYQPTRVVLANGLEVVVVPNHRAPVVHQMLWYRVGAMDEPAGHSGIAHYLEHLMFKGTPTVPAGEFSKQIAAVGGHDNAFTGHDYTAYFATVPASFLPQLMQMEADRMRNLSLTEALAKPELDVVLAERRQRTDDNPAGRFAEKFDQAIYGSHPYGRPVIGWKAEVEQLTLSMAKDFYHAWYAPNNAVLIISGDVTAERAVALANASFGKIPKRYLPPRMATRTLYQPRSTPETLILQDADVQQTTIQRHYVAPTYQTAKGNQAYALEVLAQILDGGSVGRLYRTLVMDKKLATETGADYNPQARGLGSFRFAFALPPNGNVGKTVAALDEMLKKLLKKGVTQAEVNLAVKQLRRAAIFTRDQLKSPGYAFGMALMSGQTVAEVENWPERISHVTVADVNAAAKALFGGKNYVTGVLVPERHNKSLGTGLPQRIKTPAEEMR